MKPGIILTFMAALFLGGMSVFTACKKIDYVTTTTTDVNIVGYLRNHSDSFSLFVKILERTEYSSFLNAYGKYTCFAPTNKGVQEWLQYIGAASVEAADIEKLNDMARFHVLGDSVATGAFKDGKLPVPTMYGQYLITGISVDNSVSSFIVNRQARVLQSNIRTGNGIIHILDNALKVADVTIARQLEANADYSIFVQALKETGYYDTLDKVDADTSRRFKTVFAESNKALTDSGFSTYEKLKARYSKTGNPKLAKDSLNIYVAYHILPSLQYLGDIVTQSSQITLQPQEVISIKNINQQVVLNEDVFNGIVEKGIVVQRSTSDNSASNGVWHNPLGHFMVKYRKPTAVFWDVCTFPEVVNQVAVYKKTSTTFAKPSQEARPIASIDWEFKNASGSVSYNYGTSGSVTQSCCNNDVFTFSFGLNNRSGWMELKTPPIVKGRYKVWICYSYQSGIQTNVLINGTLMQRAVSWGEQKPAGTDNQLEALGWKRYTVSTASPRPAGRLVGTIDIQTTGTQTVRFTHLSGSQSTLNLDMIHFIPVDDPQFLPRFGTDGLPVYQ